ncbi:amidohydrolase [Shivajiella indica]|uniref:Amidohydrolase n=1 Tax=Shivajiella indica TaxID=872115 RepID=A0ABW5BBR9_9BACT
MQEIAPIIKIALVQTNLFWKDKTANLAMLEEKLMNFEGETDLIILPEMFPTGFTMEVEEVSEPMNFTTTRWMKQIAKQKKSVVTGSVVIREHNKYFNRLLWVDKFGNVDWYDKRHLFRMAEEDAYYAMGTERKVFDIKGWKILPQVCYDLRFPVWSRNRVEGDKMEYDIALYVASWPSPRISAWDILLQARAVENLCYAIGVNRIGQDGNSIPYSGHSGAYNFKGEKLAFSSDEEVILPISLDYASLVEFREKFPAWKDADEFQLK